MLSSDQVYPANESSTVTKVMVAILGLTIISALIFLLNFFDILPIWKPFPVLSFLPRLSILHTTSLSIADQKTDIYKSLPVVLKSAYLPTPSASPSALLRISDGSTMSWGASGVAPQAGAYIKSKYQFSNHDLAAASFHFSTGTNLPFQKDTFQVVLGHFFTMSIPATWDCKQSFDRYTCIGNTNYKGIKIQFNLQHILVIPNRIFVTYCSIYPGNPHYNESNFCLL